jgi:large subunit ribosomal protein L9
MEVILREHVDNLGRRGDVVRVADGYARNFLLPRKLALPVTEENRKRIERERKVVEAREAEEKSAAEAIAVRLTALELSFQRRVGENETLYGSVTGADVAEAIQAQGFDVDKRKVVLAEPLKQLGEFDVPVKIHREVTAHVKVHVVPLEGQQVPAAPAPAPAEEPPAQA